MTRESDVPMDAQRAFWNDWNISHREQVVGPVSQRQASVILEWMRGLGRTDLEIIDIGCGTGWLCERMMPFGRITGTDLANEVVERARARMPGARFLAGDFMSLELGASSFDVVTTLEVLSHMGDQAAFVARIAQVLRPGGFLMMATQNRFVLERSGISPPQHGQLRRWVNRRELLGLLRPHFEVERAFAVTPAGHGGVLRFVNSIKVNRFASRFFGEARVTRFKEALGVGWTLMALARKREPAAGA
jgi:2-polyprenyl-3-methyl-5-hydroxy-6-metoxy-1,4-benzoquinol methylase